MPDKKVINFFVVNEWFLVRLNISFLMTLYSDINFNIFFGVSYPESNYKIVVDNQMEMYNFISLYNLKGDSKCNIYNCHDYVLGRYKLRGIQLFIHPDCLLLSDKTIPMLYDHCALNKLALFVQRHPYYPDWVGSIPGYGLFAVDTNWWEDTDIILGEVRCSPYKLLFHEKVFGEQPLGIPSNDWFWMYDTTSYACGKCKELGLNPFLNSDFKNDGMSVFYYHFKRSHKIFDDRIGEKYPYYVAERDRIRNEFGYVWETLLDFNFREEVINTHNRLFDKHPKISGHEILKFLF